MDKASGFLDDFGEFKIDPVLSHNPHWNLGFWGVESGPPGLSRGGLKVTPQNRRFHWGFGWKTGSRRFSPKMLRKPSAEKSWPRDQKNGQSIRVFGWFWGVQNWPRFEPQSPLDSGILGSRKWVPEAFLRGTQNDPPKSQISMGICLKKLGGWYENNTGWIGMVRK